jgi:hypothetical protein
LQSNNNELYRRHIATHSERSAEDRAAVSTLETFLTSDGKINTNFSCDDKWPNHDGTFEFVSEPEISRCPEQNFIVQIKGTHNYKDVDGIISYSLTSLAFPAFIASEVTADPGILFIVLNPDVRGKKRVFWKYLSPSFIQSIDFGKNSTTIKLSSEDEIEDTDESVNMFCHKLQKIIDIHLFLSKLDKDNLRKEEAVKIIETRCEDISLEIDRISDGNKSRDYISRRIVNGLYDLCYAVLVLNAINLGYVNVNERLAWELSQFNIETKYLSNFLKGLKYIGSRIPEEGQSERLMLKYYNYLWEIRRFLKTNFNIDVLRNLERFPLNTDTLDVEYYEMVASSIYDIVFVDECSTIDNRTMKRLLEKIDESTLLVLAGDIYQIESIDFGNWFYYAKDIIKTDGANVELLNTWRTDKKELKGLWDEVRKIQPIITEKLAIDGPFSADIGEEIFVSQGEDEIVLCLNYDGKFGLNNMNLYFQNANTKSEVYTWAEWTFKVGDPVIFLDTKRSPLLYNNLKGRIVDISKRDLAILFTLDIDTILTERQCRNESFEFVDVTDRGTRIRLEVIASDDESAPEEERFKTIIPFQIAYAVSIHKAQGLEYNSVKIIIPSYNAEKISHSIFYTAITRAKEKLKIFWSAETMKAIVESFDKEKIGQRTLEFIEKKLE